MGFDAPYHRRITNLIANPNTRSIIKSACAIFDPLRNATSIGLFVLRVPRHPDSSSSGFVHSEDEGDCRTDPHVGLSDGENLVLRLGGNHLFDQ